jgi:hypothetical protein
MDKRNLSGNQIGLGVLGLAAWAIAGLIFGNSTDYNQVVIQAQTAGGSAAAAVAPNIKAGLAAFGFALAGGLCFLGVAIAELAPTLASRTPQRPEQGAP